MFEKFVIQRKNKCERVATRSSPKRRKYDQDGFQFWLIHSQKQSVFFGELFETYLRQFLTEQSVAHPRFGLLHYMQTPMIFINLYNKLWTMIIPIDSMKSEILKREQILSILPHSKIEFKL